MYSYIQYLQSLQDRLKEAASKNSLLLQENDLLRKKVHKLEEENKHLKTSSSSAASSPMNGRVAVMVVMVLLGFSIGFFPTRCVCVCHIVGCGSLLIALRGCQSSYNMKAP